MTDPTSPSDGKALLDQLVRALSDAGLVCRGCFRPSDRDGVPPLERGVPARTVVLVGNAGPAMWERFSREREPGPHPLDAWSRATLAPFAQRFGAAVVYPFQEPPLPFQRWLVRADRCHFSPLGILVHPDYGLWHAVRGALLFDRDLPFAEAAPAASPCATCPDRPCLTTCPAAAFSDAGYDVPRCVTHLGSKAGEDCLQLGCRARRACPVGRSFRYAPAQANLHMQAFFDAMSRYGSGGGAS